MTVSQCTTQAFPGAAEVSATTAESGQTGMPQTGLFNSIFAGLFESGDPAMPAQTGEGGNGQEDVPNARDLAGNCTERMKILFHQVKDAIAMRTRLNPDMKETVEIDDASIAAKMCMQLNEHGHAVRQINAGSDEAVSGKEKSPGEEIVTGETPEEILGILGMLTVISQPTATVLSPKVPGNAADEPTDGQDVSGLTPVKSGEVTEAGISRGMFDDRVTGRTRNLVRVTQGMEGVEPAVSKVDLPDAGFPGQSGRGLTETGCVPVPAEITIPDESIAGSSETKRPTAQNIDNIMQPRKNPDPPNIRQQLFESISKEGKGDNGQVVAAVKEDDRNLSGIRVQNQGKQDQNALQASVSTGANDPVRVIHGEKPVSEVKGVDFGKIEVTFGDSSPAGDFSEKSGESAMNSADNGKGNLKFSDLNPGMRSTDLSPQSHSQTQNTVSEPPRPVSHEEIVSQVREKLAEHRLNGDTGRITMKLHPEHLGDLRIDMKMENHRLKVEIVAENQNVKDALVHHLDTLKDTLSRQNIAMDRFNVLTGGGGNSSGSYRDWRHTGQNAQPNPFVRFSGFSEETPQSNISYLDSSENSMVDLRL